IIWVIGGILQCAAVNRGMLVVGRIIAGISVGLASTVVPIYQSEITAPSIRGRLVSMQQWSITWGIMLQYFVQFGCSYIDGTASFRIPWGVQIIPAIILGLSPRWLVDHGREEEALQILADLHGNGNRNDPLVELEFEEIRQQVNFEQNEGAKSYADLLKPGVFRRVGLGCSLQMWSQLSGMNVMMYYIIYVFEGAGLTGRRGNLIADSVQYVLNMGTTSSSNLWFHTHGFFLCLVGGLQGKIYGEWGTVNDSPVWVIINHDSALRVRAKAVSLATATNWVFNFALAWAVPPALTSIAWKTYFIFATFNFAAAIHFTLCYPETAQRTLEEVEEVFSQGHIFSAWAISRDCRKEELARHMWSLGAGCSSVFFSRAPQKGCCYSTLAEAPEVAWPLTFAPHRTRVQSGKQPAYCSPFQYFRRCRSTVFTFASTSLFHHGNPHEMVVPDYTTVEYTEARAMFTAEGKSDHEAATILANVWRFNNTHARQLWDRQQEEAEQDWLAERTRRSELAEQERITREEEEELAKREERKKYKNKYTPIPNIPLSDAPIFTPCRYADAKIRQGEYCPLFYYTNRGHGNNQNFPALDDGTLALIRSDSGDVLLQISSGG
ncbi:hypothetical protein BU15DRAFT_69372, partial [Melanogaster broomeanus]